MRLEVLDRGHRLRARVALRLIRLLGRTEPDPVAKTVLYRPAVFGRPWGRLIRSIMRGPSEWSHGERELIAAHVSRLNECRFCHGVHTGTASMLLGPAVVERLDRWREGEFDERLAATFALLERVTRTPDELRPGDVARVRAAGVSASGVADALYICFVFNTVNRLAGAFGYDWATEVDRVRLAAGLNRIGYRIPGFLLR